MLFGTRLGFLLLSSVNVSVIIAVSLLSACKGMAPGASNTLNADREQTSAQTNVPELLRPLLKLTNNRVFTAWPQPINVNARSFEDEADTKWSLQLRIFDFETKDTYDTSFKNQFVTFTKPIPINKMNLSDRYETIEIYRAQSNGFVDSCNLTANLQYLAGNGETLQDPRSPKKPQGDAAALRSIRAGSYQLNYVRYFIENLSSKPPRLKGIKNQPIQPNAQQALYKFVMGSKQFNSFAAVTQLVESFQRNSDDWTKRVTFEFGANPFFVLSCASRAPLASRGEPTSREISVDDALAMLSQVGVAITNSPTNKEMVNPAPDATDCAQRLRELDQNMEADYQNCLSKASSQQEKAWCESEWKPEQRTKRACASRAMGQ